MRVSVAMLLALAACYRPAPEAHCAVVCGTSGECPTGLSCNGAGFCTTSAVACVVDAPEIVPPACDLKAPFGMPVPLTEINSPAEEYAASLSPDLLTIYFDSMREDGSDLDVYQATRDTPKDVFDKVLQLPLLNSSSHDARPVLSPDGLTLYQTSFRDGGGDIYVAMRSEPDDPFPEPVLLDGVNDGPALDSATAISASGTTLYLSSLRTGDWQLFRATRGDPGDTFASPQPISELNVIGSEDYGAVITRDEQTLYFESDRPGGIACQDIYVAARSPNSDRFDTPMLVTELSTASCEWPVWVSPDGCSLMFSSDRSGGLGGSDLWLATKP